MWIISLYWVHQPILDPIIIVEFKYLEVWNDSWDGNFCIKWKYLANSLVSFTKELVKEFLLQRTVSQIQI